MSRHALWHALGGLLWAPMAYAACDVASAIPATGTFTNVNGQEYSPTGQPWIAKGINLMQGQEGDLARIIATLPGINLIRFNILDLNTPASAYAGFVQQAAAAGILVLFDDHTNNANNGDSGGGGGTIYQGAELQQELNWFHDAATFYSGYRNFGFDTNNEPSNKLTEDGPPDPAALSIWQDQTYHAIRDGTGFTGPIAIQVNGDANPADFGAGLNTAFWAGYTNVIAEVHDYGWVTGYSTDQATVTQNLLANIAYTQHLTTANGPPAILVGEYGPSTTGNLYDGVVQDDPNGTQLVNAVIGAGVSSAAWGWHTGAEDNLVDANGNLTQFGLMIRAYFSSTVCPGQIPYIPVPPNTPHVLPQTPLPVVADLPFNLQAPIATPAGGTVTPSQIAADPTLPVPPVPPAPEPDMPAAPEPDLPVPPVPDMPNAPEPSPAQPAVIPGTPIDIQYHLIPVTPTIPVMTPDAGPYDVIINSPPPPLGTDPAIAWTIAQIQTATRNYGMINPIGSFLERMDGSILAAGDVALQGMPALLTIPVTVLALVFLGAKGVRVQADVGGTLHSLWFDLIKIALIMYLSLDLGHFDTWVRDLIYIFLPNALTGAVAAGVTGVASGVHAVATTMDALFSEAWVWVSKTWSDAGLTDPCSAIAAFFCGITVFGCLASMSMIYLVSRMLLMVVIVFGPIAIACSMHRVSAPIFERWVGKCVSLVFLQVAGIIILTMVLSANQFFMDQIAPLLHAKAPSVLAQAVHIPWQGIDFSPSPTAASDVEALCAMVVWFGMGALALYTLPVIAYSLGTGIAMSFAPLVFAGAAAGMAIGSAVSAGLAAIPAFSGGASAGALSMELARDDIEASAPFNELPSPPPPLLA